MNVARAGETEFACLCEEKVFTNDESENLSAARCNGLA
jgi:hypothetical protein